MAVDAVVVVVVPEEIIMLEILIRLPIKSLVRFRCVCKSWNSQLYNPDYLYLFSRNPNRDNDDYLIFMSNNYMTRQDIIPRGLYILTGAKILSKISRINNVPAYPLSFSKLLLQDDIHLIGSVNGLVCMAFYFEHDHEHLFILWNPTIRLSKTILVPNDLGLRSSFAEEDFLYGFGWDSVTNDYKIIITPLTTMISRASVYSSKTDCWSNINDSARSIVINSAFKDKKCEPTCVIVNGSPCWKSYWKDSNIILKFDVTSNEFTSLNPPSGCFNYSLINLNDCLALIDYGNWSTQGVVYSFDEEHHIWVQMYTICKSLSLRSNCFTYDGGIMFHEKNFWYWYDLKSHELKSCTVPFDNCGGSLGNGFSYTLSLVALPGMKALHV